MHPLVEYGPAEEVEFLRCVEVGGVGVDAVVEKFGVEVVALAQQRPYLAHAAPRRRVVLDNPGHELLHVSGGRGTGITVDEIGFTVDIECARIVVESQVLVPDGAGDEPVGASLLIHICAPVGVGVAGELAADEIAQEAVEVKITAVAALGVGIVGGIDSVDHHVEIVLYVAALRVDNLIVGRRLYCHRYVVVGVEPRNLLVGIGVDFQEVAPGKSLAGHIVGSHLRDVNTSRTHLHLVAELIATFIFSVVNHVDEAAVGSVFQSYGPAHVERHTIAHQRLVAVVVDQSPLLGFCRSISENLLFLVKFYLKRLLLHLP